MMMKRTMMIRKRRFSERFLYAILILIATSLPAMTPDCHAQSDRRKITPVDVDEKKPQQPVLHYYDKHGNQLDEPVLFLAELDTVAKAKSGPKYPIYNGVSFGVNFADAILSLAGQKHYSFDLHADVSLHNWFFPTIEAGIGFADNTPEDGNFTYKCFPSPYLKVGLNYNFLYKSNPAYQCFLGLRGCWSDTRYEITNISITSDYWSQTQSIAIRDQHAHALFGEVLAGVKVKIAGNFSLGWSARFRMMFNKSEGSNSVPWFFPGYGTGSPLSLTFSAMWTIPAKAKVNETTLDK